MVLITWCFEGVILLSVLKDLLQLHLQVKQAVMGVHGTGPQFAGINFLEHLVLLIECFVHYVNLQYPDFVH